MNRRSCLHVPGLEVGFCVYGAQGVLRARAIASAVDGGVPHAQTVS